MKNFINIAFTVILVAVVGYFAFIKEPKPTIPSQPKLKTVTYEDLSRTPQCLNAEGERIINSNEEYDRIIQLNPESAPGCKDFKRPAIDFSQKTLLAKSVISSGCTNNFGKEVYVDDDNKKIIYEIDFSTLGQCEALVHSDNWISIDKVPNSYKVEFSLKLKKI